MPQIGLEYVQLSCKKNNIASLKSISKNGGVYKRSFNYDNEEANVYSAIL